MIDFAEEEIYLPDGPHKGERFNRYTQPWAGLFLEEVGSGRWQRSALTGGTQAGKSLVGYVFLCLYHLFEIGETVVLGLPGKTMANDKWERDILPVIKLSRYKSLLPERGQGSRSGAVKDAVTFQNGATLKFMSGGGGDATRSGFTSRIVAVTEADKMDAAGGASKETDKVSQMQARTDAFGDQGRIYLECTPSFEDGLIWREYTSGTQSRIACPCPHCKTYVTPERENLTGWAGAPNEIEARRNAHWCCPHCGSVISEAERAEMNRSAILVHKGQRVIEGGTIEGDLPQTLTLGFRFNAFNNMFWTGAVIAARELKNSLKTDADAAEKESLQFVWAKPAKPRKRDLTELEATVIAARIAATPRGRVPVDADKITLGIDIGLWLIHYTAVAWRTNASPHVIEYGRIEVPSDIAAEEIAILNALRQLRDDVASVGWPSVVNPAGEGMKPELSLVDAGYNTDTILRFCEESPGFVGCKGFASQQRSNRLDRATGSRVVAVGDHYNLIKNADGRQYIEADANHWKAWLHQRLKTPIGESGALTLYQMDRKPDGRLVSDHLKFAHHLLAERQVEIIEKGEAVIKFVEISRNNHWLDSTSMASVAGHAIGVRLIGAEKPKDESTAAPAEEPGFNPLTSHRGKW